MSNYRNRLGDLGSVYHVFSRGLDRKPLFHDDLDRNTFLLILRDALEVTDTRCFAYALMPNHHHNTLRTISTPISDVMHRINTRYAMYHNRRHGGSGHVFQGRFGSVLIEGEAHLATAIAYVHANPIRAGLVADESALRDYPWTGHASLMGRRPETIVDTTSVLSMFGTSTTRAREALASTMQSYVTGVDAETPLAWAPDDTLELSPRDAITLSAHGVGGIVGDSERVNRVLVQRDETTAARLRLTRAGWTPERLLHALSRTLGVYPGPVRAGRCTRAHCRVRALFCHLATTYLGLSLAAAAREVGLGTPGASRARRLGEQLMHRLGLSLDDVFRVEAQNAGVETRG